MLPKKTGDLRVILNLKKINVFISVQHFHMEILNFILPNLRPQDWAVSIDLKDAYLHVPVPSVQETAGFQIPRQDFRVQGLAFRPKRLSVGLFEGNSSPSPAGHPYIYFYLDELTAFRGVPVTPPVTPSCHSSVGSEFGVHRLFKFSVLTHQ